MVQPGDTGGGLGGAAEGAAKPAAAMVSLQLVFSVLQIFIKLALNDGMDARVLVAYRFMFAAAFLCPIAFLVERKKRPPLTMKVALQLFLCGLFGFAINQNLYVLAIKLTSATFVTAISNLTPATTFILAIVTRLEALNLRKPAGQAKLLGTLVGMGGAMLLTFYKGPEIKILRRLPRLRLVRVTEDHHSGPPSARNQVLGSLLGVISCFSYATWLVIQAKAGQVYPCHYSIAAMVCLFGALQSTLVAVCVHRDMEHWRLGLNIRLYSSAYAGLIASGSAFPLLSWCLRKRGPLFIAVFSPLMLIFVAALSSILLDEALHLGSVLGSVLIVSGLYLVLWGKAKEVANGRQDEERGKESVPAAAGEIEIK
ncbi:WAT1-related protein At1g68170-like [Phragmites australis]|uniref:WAT1-related protein At1g68170-like n=1 Tax=Phragmites australis TaxID=29695 RepID=UPI002D79D8A2|nr:WAT1-related protein At1g68170-like [Phragmites australis]